MTNQTEGKRPGAKKQSPPDSLIRVVRASEKPLKPTPSESEKPEEILPVELLAGRKRPPPKGRFVTAGKLEWSETAAAKPGQAAEGAKPRPRFVSRPGPRGQGGHGGRPPRGAGKPKR